LRELRSIVAPDQQDARALVEQLSELQGLETLQTLATYLPTRCAEW
jgi:hypothetical protein